jgi:uncharacterized membrane protein YhaH (DUF805 family)
LNYTSRTASGFFLRAVDKGSDFIVDLHDTIRIVSIQEANILLLTGSTRRRGSIHSRDGDQRQKRTAPHGEPVEPWATHFPGSDLVLDTDLGFALGKRPALGQFALLPYDVCHDMENGMSALKFIYFNFDGRIDRRTWWMAWALLLMVETGANYVLSKAMDDDAPFINGTWPNLVRVFGDRSGWIIAFLFLIPNIAMNTKRFHDVGRSGWYWLVFVVPFLLATAVTLSPLGGVEYPTSLAGHLHLAAGLAALWTLYTLGLRPSQPQAAPG